jgi:hypothetical protein
MHNKSNPPGRLVNLMRKKALDRTGNADHWRELFKPLPFGRGCARPMKSAP